MALASSMALSQFSVDVNDYIHTEYYVPDPWGNCAWAGMASGGCAKPGYSFDGGECWAIAT
jgi:hypothetical protein